MSSSEIEIKNKTKKIVILFTIIFLALLVFLYSIFRTITEKRNLPSLTSQKTELSVRGNIVSADNFKIASSKKLYKASIDTRYLDSNKKELFLTLFSIYSNISYKELSSKFKKHKNPGNLILSYNIDSRAAKNLKELDLNLRQLEVFVPRQINGSRIVRSLSITESGEKRIFSYKDTLTPVVGYITKFESNDGKTKVNGIKGLENSYNKYLNNTKNGILEGYRDVLSYIYFDKQSTMSKRNDGYSLYLNIPLKLQKNIENVLDKHKKRLSADEIIVTIMESKTGKILSLATSNRFNPERITQKDIPYLNVNAVEYQFEPGSIVKPLSILLAMDKGLVAPDENFSAYNQNSNKGGYPIGKYIIKDDHKFNSNFINLNDIVIYSSNIGTLQIAQRLTGPEFLEGMKKFGFTRKTGIDLPYEKKGVLPKLWQFSVGDKDKKDNIYKATVSFGQGMTSTFMQIIKAYSVFNNDGAMVTPKIVSYLSRDNESQKFYLTNEKSLEKVVSKEAANDMKKMLIRAVNEGTGRSTKIDGLEIGGKTGTAQIAGGTGYLKKYVSSFFGFVNDNHGRSYTVGVTVINPTSKNSSYYAAQSAAPVFKQLVQNLIQLNYLTPNTDIISKKK